MSSDSAAEIAETIRLHITPLTAATSAALLPPTATNTSFHTLPTFPERPFAFTTLPVADAKALKKKYHNAFFRGVKMLVTDARPEVTVPRSVAQDTEEKKKVKKTKTKPEPGVVSGFELPDGRKVKRGWDKKGECVVNVAVPKNRAMLADESGKKKKRNLKEAGEEKVAPRKRKIVAVVKEGENTTIFPQFLKENQLDPKRGKDKLVGEYVEGKGWLDAEGKVVEETRKKKKSTPVVPIVLETKQKPSSTALKPVENADKKPTKVKGVVSFSDEESADEKGPISKPTAVVYHSSSESEAPAPAEDSSDESSNDEDVEMTTPPPAETLDKPQPAPSSEDSSDPSDSSSDEESSSGDKDEDVEMVSSAQQEPDDDTPSSSSEDEDEDEDESSSSEDEESVQAKPINKLSIKTPINTDSSSSSSSSSCSSPVSSRAASPKPTQTTTTTTTSTETINPHALEALYKPTDVPTTSHTFTFGFGGPDSDSDSETPVTTTHTYHYSSAPPPDVAITEKNKRSAKSTAPAPAPFILGAAATGSAVGKLFFPHPESAFLSGSSQWVGTPSWGPDVYLPETQEGKGVSEKKTAKKIQFDEDGGYGGEVVGRVEVWKKLFYEKRGEWNREWKRRRSEAVKSKRRRERAGLVTVRK